MAQNFLYVNTDGDYEESSGAYEQSDFISSSAGAGDAGKPIVLDAGGKVDASMIEFGDIDHGSTSGLGDDDHTQYTLADGTRDFSGIVQYSSHPSFSADTDIVDKKYVDMRISGLDPKASVRCATAAALAAYTPSGSGVGKTITADANGALTVDGISVSAGDRVLIKDENSGGAHVDHGIYTVTAVGDVGTPFVLTRATDFDEDAEVTANAYTMVAEGTVNADTGWMVFTNDDITVDTTAIDWGQFHGPGTYTGGAGINVVSGVISIDLATASGLSLSGDELAVSNDSTTGGNVAGVMSVTSNGLGVVIDNHSVIENGSNQLEVDVTNIIDTNYGLTEDTNNIRVNVESDGAIVFDGSNYGLEVSVDDSTIEISTNALQVKADGINDTHINWGTGANQVSASDVPILDSAGYTDATDVEGAIADIFDNFGVNYNAGTGGVSTGDLVYVSANDTALPLPITGAGSNNFGIGLAAADAIASASFRVLGDDTVLEGILSGATAGDKYYWDGSTLTTTMPATSTAYVWRVGVAKNATDLHVDVEFVKKNA